VVKAHALILPVLTAAGCAAVSIPGFLPETSQGVDGPIKGCCAGDSGSVTGAGGTSAGGAQASPQPLASPAPAGVVQATIPVGPAPRGLALDHRGRVWVAVSGGGQVARLADDKVAERLSAPGPVDLAFDATGSVWVASNGGVFGFDASGSPLVGASDGTAEAVGVSGSFLFATFPKDGAIRRYPIGRSGLGTAVTLPGSAGAPRDLLVDPVGRLWVALGETNAVARYDAPAATPSAPVLVFNAGGDPGGLAKDNSNRILVIGNNTIVSVSEGAPRTLLNNSLLAGATRMAVDRGGIIWAAASSGNRLVGVTGEGKLASPSPTGLAGPADVLVDPVGRLWVSNELGGTVTRLSGS